MLLRKALAIFSAMALLSCSVAPVSAEPVQFYDALGKPVNVSPTNKLPTTATLSGDITIGTIGVDDGGDVAQGAMANAAATDSTSAWSVISLLKGIFAKLLSTLAVTQSGTWNITNVSGTVSLPTNAASETGGNLAATATVLGATADAAVTTSATGSISAKLRGIISLLNSGITVATHAVTQSGTWNITNISGTVSLPTGAATQTTLASVLAALGTTADAKNSASDTTAITIVSILKQLSFSMQALAASVGTAIPAGTAIIGHTLTDVLYSTSMQMQGCDVHKIYDAATNGATELEPLSSGKVNYICGYTIRSAGTAVNAGLVYGTGTNCGTGQNPITPMWQLTTYDGLVDSSTFWRGTVTPASQAVCFKASAAQQLEAEVWLAQR